MHTHLVKLRAERGLSQQKLADLLGATKLTVSRWERGAMSPRRYFIERLCRVFECEESALGFASEAQTLESEELVSVLSDPALPPLEALPLIGRDCALSLLQARLCTTEEQMALVAIHGLAGVGKTSLATTLVNTQEIREHFSDGILWATLGPTPNLSELITRWAALLGLSAATLSALSIQEQCQALHAAIGMRSILLVLDDVWQLEHMHILLSVGGPNCSFLITTRFPTLAVDGDANPLWLRELNKEQSIEVLRQLVPEVLERELEKMRALAEAVGGHPLALTLLGNYLRKESYCVAKRRAVCALDRLTDVEVRFKISHPSVPALAHPGLPESMPLSLSSILEASDHLLTDRARKTLYALSVLPPKPEGFSEDAALAVTGCSTRELDELLDAGLLEYQETNQYQLHPVISDYAWLHLDEQAGREARHRLLLYKAKLCATDLSPTKGIVWPASLPQTALCMRQTAGREWIRPTRLCKGWARSRHPRGESALIVHLGKSTPNRVEVRSAGSLLKVGGESVFCARRYSSVRAFLRVGETVVSRLVRAGRGNAGSVAGRAPPKLGT